MILQQITTYESLDNWGASRVQYKGEAKSSTDPKTESCMPPIHKPTKYYFAIGDINNEILVSFRSIIQQIGWDIQGICSLYINFSAWPQTYTHIYNYVHTVYSNYTVYSVYTQGMMFS